MAISGIHKLQMLFTVDEIEEFYTQETTQSLSPMPLLTTNPEK